jgi:Glycosyltransferases involved in cell wall biogenesis
VISVIIPALNEEDVIEYCLQSLENQNYKNFEIIVVDGGSKDRTVEIAEKYARVIKQKSKTIGGARKEGTLAAKGDILAFTDADTIFDPNWLSSIEKSMKNLMPLLDRSTFMKTLSTQVCWNSGEKAMLLKGLLVSIESSAQTWR